MPHASGGGSHSGGSHTSSHHSSSSHRSSGGSYRSSGGSHSGGFFTHSSSSSRSSYSSYRGSSSYSGSSSARRSNNKTTSYTSYTRSTRGSASRPHTSATPFTGATRYVYYRDKTPHYVYSDYSTFEQQKHPLRFFLWLPLIILILSATFSLSTPVSKINTRYDHRIVIEDHLNVIDRPEQLQAELTAFYEKTGITPCVITETNEAWQKNYQSLETRAYDLYVNHFDDECHWLIVYTEPEHPDKAFVDWYWQSMQGDETDKILTEEAIALFTKTAHRYFTSSLYSPGRAITKAFSELTPTLMSKAEGSTASVIFGLLIAGLFLFVAIRRAGFYHKKTVIPSEIPSDARPVSTSSTELSCSYCNGVYLSDRTRCPHCGAARQSPGL